ncbi:uroporphyrinogen decarboxylase family protein [Paenibacillus agaridevorans]|uniref:uroporphyrinogen decarboxylase family protein n=1 Tax=Paenibacillus agaridevorans TaxID=171404 RepID=UPI001BE4B125|nr:uroporphyrinogen decarboxylase family protein [Paenibacillus agaridevorans]
MDKITRMLRTLNQEAVDYPPVGFWFHFNGEEGMGQACVDAHLNYYRETDIDFIKIMCDGYFQFPLAVEIKEVADWRKIKPLSADHPYITEQVERARLITEGVNGECCTFYSLFAPFSCIRFATSDELVMKHLKEDPEAVLYALTVIAEDQAALAERLIAEAGCTGIYYCLQGGEMDRFTEGEYRNLIMPSDRYVLDRANGFSPNNLLHMCGWAGVRNRLDNWREYPAKAVNWAIYVEGLGIREGREYLGDHAVLGGFDNTKSGVLHSGTRSEVEQFAKQLVAEAGTQGLIVGADCSLSHDIDRERIKWVVETVRSA